MADQNNQVVAMAERADQDAGPVVRQDTPISLSDKETDTFEDAVDNSSVRSLTGRKHTGLHSPSPDPESGCEDGKRHPLEVSVDELPTSETSPGSSEADSRKAARISALSTNGSLANVALDDDANTAAPNSGNSVANVRIGADKDKDKDKEKDLSSSNVTEKELPRDPPNKSLSLSSIKGALPSMPTMPWSPHAEKLKEETAATAAVACPPPPPPASEKPTQPAPPAAGRKLTSPFSWLSRNSNSKDAVATPPIIPPSPRRNTASSVTTIVSNPEMMLSKLEEEGEGRPNTSRNSLKDRFKFVRMREEASLSVPEGQEGDKSGGAVASLIGKSGAIGIGGMGVDDHGMAHQTPTSPIPTSPDRTLAPGTAVGVSAGPSSINDTAVDWDLWQSVVYEGPAAVARTSAEELNKAIATGIPNAIRGVIWQVLAQSKNEGMEIVYKELVVRGTDKDKDRHSAAASVSSGSNLNVATKDVTSSASSTHSTHSGATGAPSPSEKEVETMVKAQAAATTEMKKREKEDAAKVQKLEKTIKRDLGARTSYSKFAAASGLQDGLFGVCKAYALFDEAVGYAQGMNFVVMPLLFNMPEEEAFCLLVRLMNQYGLRDMFVVDMPGLHKALYRFERLLEDLEPALYCHLHRRGISPHLYATQWFLTLFAYRFPLQLVLRVYDLIFSEGLSAVLRFGIVLMQKNAQTLLGMTDMSALTNYLKDKLFDVYIDSNPSTGSILENGFFGSSSSAVDKEVYRADQLIRDACEVRITPELLKAYGDEWEDKTRMEKERELELEQLRNSNANLGHRVKLLESQIETVDREQTSLATELVHTKVRNEELSDENESLKGQVRELRVVIEKQPEEIEAVWQQEREDLMKRNEKVHEENQKLEKEMQELEDELVATKLRYAEINEKHETLTRKWADLKKQIQ
ncbi:uncharacterized protein MKZ38_002346 [Zalerion maritima]|uniref:GTPase-activating protein GYP5 n=1 Tax=Zalerion maritima TaxID=339359 RepID=A0AAD5RZA4_9PEZI|nr:uncharacterized protein MKZ38_002346 [Zalerion maritima]